MKGKKEGEAERERRGRKKEDTEERQRVRKKILRLKKGESIQLRTLVILVSFFPSIFILFQE